MLLVTVMMRTAECHLRRPHEQFRRDLESSTQLSSSGMSFTKTSDSGFSDQAYWAILSFEPARFKIDNRRSIEELGVVYLPIEETLADHYTSWGAQKK